MKQTLTDFSQLSKGMFKTASKPVEVKPEIPADSGSSREDEEVLAYFSRPSGRMGDRCVRKQGGRVLAAKAELPQSAPVAEVETALREQLRVAESARQQAETRLADSERTCAELTDALAAMKKEVTRLQGECGRLQGELRKAGEEQPEPEEAVVESVETPSSKTSPDGLLTLPSALAEAFPGELREIIVSVLSDARDASRQSSRERRAAILDAVLAVNRPTGELERRRAALKQIMKDSGGYTDPRALGALGFRLVSGRTHWKVEYAGIRMPLSKTPSDYRSNQNAAADMANRCF